MLKIKKYAYVNTQYADAMTQTKLDLRNIAKCTSYDK